MLKGVLLVCGIFSFSTFAESNNVKGEFTSVYNAYKQSLKSTDKASTLELAKKSYLLGCDYYGKNNINCGSLTLNYANALSNDSELMNSLFEKAVNISKKEFGENSIELADVYSQVANKNIGYKNRKFLSASEKAIGIANSLADENPIASAQIKLVIGESLLRNQSVKSKIILEANEELKKHLKDNDFRLIKSRFLTAKYLQAKGKMKRSIIPLEKNIEIFNRNQGATQSYELVSRAFLVRAYEESNQRDKATEHCIAIGNLTPWNENQDPEPLYRVNPNYPLEQVKRGNSGWVKLAFTIDKNGFVTEPSAVDSNGSKSFIKESIKAIKQWRYAPKFENGHAVAVKSTVQLDFKVG